LGAVRSPRTAPFIFEKKFMNEEKPKQDVDFLMLKNIVANTIRKQNILEGRIKFIEEQLGLKFEGISKNVEKPKIIKPPTLVT
jgi:hypothetical protein